AIDLRVVKLAGTDQAPQGGAYTGGPKLTLATSTPELGFETGVNFLGKGMFNGKVKLTTEANARDPNLKDKVVAVRLGTNASFGRLELGSALEFDFKYTRTAQGENKFAIGQWPNFLAKDLFDLVKAIKDLADKVQTSVCDALTDLV